MAQSGTVKSKTARILYRAHFLRGTSILLSRVWLRTYFLRCISKKSRKHSADIRFRPIYEIKMEGNIGRVGNPLFITPHKRWSIFYYIITQFVLLSLIIRWHERLIFQFCPIIWGIQFVLKISFYMKLNIITIPKLHDGSLNY